MTERPCPYCSAQPALVGGDVIYPHRPDLSGKRFWHCAPCQAWVGCHDGTTRPLGRLANAELRRCKERAHAAFDLLWKRKMATGVSKKQARDAGYAWLAGQLGIAREDCHIGMMDIELCRRVVEICAPYSGGK